MYQEISYNLTGKFVELCNECKQWLPPSAFRIDKRRGQRAYYCNACFSNVTKTWAKAHKTYGMVARAKKRAAQYGVPFSIVPSDLVIPRLCPVLGIPLELECDKPSPGSPSLDRIIPSLGYVKNNVAVISLRANSIKNNATAEELRKVADWIDTKCS